MKRLMDDYNYHDWSEFMVREPKDQPQGRHYAVVLFDSKSMYEPPWDSKDSGSYYSEPVTTYFAFNDKEMLSEWIKRATKANMKFFFFEVKKPGTAEVKVSVDVDVDT